jgi:hypothetical protein
VKLYTRILSIALLLILAILVISPSPVLAIAPPDSPPSIREVTVYSFSDGSVGVLIDYYIDYAVLPTTETAAESYMAVFIDIDGTTQIKSIAPFVFVDSGYGRGLIWIPFTAAEVATYSLDSANVALYRVWLMGNPTLVWTGAIPKTIAGIDDWNTTGDMEVLLSSKVKYYADQLELAWSLDLISPTALGNRLTTLGESYFLSVIPDLRTLAPSAFSSVETSPTYVAMDYSSEFGATASNGTAIIGGTPITLVVGNNTINTGATTGTIIIDLSNWTSGNVSNGTGTLTDSPVTIVPGVNTLTVTGNGTFIVYVHTVTTITALEDSVTGTGLDLTDLATTFGMSRWFLSSMVWILITVLICFAVYRAERRGNVQFDVGETTGAARIIMYVFTVCVIGGTLLGLLHPLVGAMLFIGCGAFIGYVLFYQSETLHKGVMFMAWMFLITSIAGGVVTGSTSITATRLESDIPSGSINTITVASTTGFPSSGIILIGDERIGYPKKTATTFERASVLGVTTNPIMRGVNGTIDASHSEGAIVRTVEAGVINASIDYKVAKIADTAGIIGFVTLPAKLLDLLVAFFVLPISFLGTDMAILTYIWGIFAIGMLVGLGVSLAGGRRV